jgi:hypothetical protein
VSMRQQLVSDESSSAITDKLLTALAQAICAGVTSAGENVACLRCIHVQSTSNDRPAPEGVKSRNSCTPCRRTGQLSAEERAKRLAEMAGFAEVHEEVRWSRQKRARDADAEEEQANAPPPAGEPFTVPALPAQLVERKCPFSRSITVL